MYEIISVILITGWIFSVPCKAQSTNAYRTVASGYFDEVSIWEIYDGTDWVPASQKPNQENDIFIENAHTVTLRKNEEVKSLYLNAAIGAGQKININGWELHLYGNLNAFEGAAPGSPRGAWNTNNWIGNSIDSKLVFKGESRTIIKEGAWSGFSINSTYAVIFDGGVGTEYIIKEPFKANRFTIKSGTVVQNWSAEEGCATFSFNTNDDFGGDPYGDLVVEDGATLETFCSEEITFRSSTQPSSLFDIKQGGNLVLKGNQPKINAATISLEGDVFYAGESGSQHFISADLEGSGVVDSYHNLSFSGGAVKKLPSIIKITGDFKKIGGGAIQQDETRLIFSGSDDQLVNNWALEVDELEIDKPGGKITVENDITVTENLIMRNGTLDLAGSNLYINTSGLGAYQYFDGQWLNLSDVYYENLPQLLTEENSTFPFVDQLEGGIRKLQLTGNHNASNPDIAIQYHQENGVNQDPDFEDVDGTPIIYQLNSYFTFSGSIAGTEDLELKISADNLMVEDPDDLRIVGNEEAAPGEHLPGEMDGEEIWSKRAVTLNELNGNAFTIGSYRVATILPIHWLGYRAEQIGKGNLITWKIEGEDKIQFFQLYRSMDGIDQFEKIAKVVSKGIYGSQSYSYLDASILEGRKAYYQIELVKQGGRRKFSPVFKLHQTLGRRNPKFTFGPNPYSGGEIFFKLPKKWLNQTIEIKIKNCQGILKKQLQGKGKIVSQELKQSMKTLNSGLYFISIIHLGGNQVIKWVKE